MVKMNRYLLPALVFFGGFANLATEIIGPRMFASMFGNATSIWAVIISVTLVGLSVGYALGGRITSADAPRALPLILVGNALWLVLLSWVVWGVPALTGGYADITLVTGLAFAAFFLPSVLFGTITPLSITLLSQDSTHDETTTIVGNLYAVGTVGSVAGALTSAFFWIPFVGLSLSLRLFAVILIGFAIFYMRGERGLAIGALVVVLIIPQPGWTWSNPDDLRLVEQREGRYQTVRVYTDDEQFIEMHLGPTFQSKIDLETGEPAYNYAATMIDFGEQVLGSYADKHVLIIGGAGHAMAHAVENRGGRVTEVEIDPVVIAMSDEHFGPINGDVVQADARVYVNRAPDDRYDLVLSDAFDSGTGIPPHLTTVEFFEQVQRILKADGVMIQNFVGTPLGTNASAYTAASTTMSAVFPSVGAHYTRDDLRERQNIIYIAGRGRPDRPALNDVPQDGRILTDDRNPIDILFELSREGLYFRR